MTIAFPCENCGNRFEVDGSLAGKKCRCKKCGAVFVVPVPRQPSAVAPARARPVVRAYGPDGRPVDPSAAPARPSPFRPAPRPDPYDGDNDPGNPYRVDDVPPAPAPPDLSEGPPPMRWPVPWPARRKK